MKIAITGSNGFIGKYVVDVLLSAGHEILALQRFKHEDKRVKTVGYDLGCCEELSAQDLLGVDAVIHLAACVHRRDATFEENMIMNFEATKHLFDLCIKVEVKKFIFLSTVGVYGVNHFEKILSLDSQINPITAYAISKFEAEKYLRSHRDENIVTSILRIPLVYGKDAPGNLGLIRRFAKRTGILPFGCIRNRRSYIMVEDLANLIAQISENIELHKGTHLLASSETASTLIISQRILRDHFIRAINLPIPKFLLKFIFSVTTMTKVYEQLCGDLIFESSIKFESGSINKDRCISIS